MSFVVRIDDMTALLESWAEMLPADGPQLFTMNDEVIQTLNEWPRIVWFYYCDDADGNTLRIYDSEHFERFVGNYYLERDDRQSQGHYERVILRGKNMWADDEANLKRPQSLRNRFRDNPKWTIFSARQAPIRPESSPPAEMSWPVRRGNPSTVDIEGKMLRERRLWYFESVNQLPVFNPARLGVQPAPRLGAATSLAERLQMLRQKPSAAQES